MKNMKILFSSVKMSGNFGFPCIVLGIEKVLKNINSSYIFEYDISVRNSEKEYELQEREKYSLKTKEFTCITDKKNFLKALLLAIKIRLIGPSRTLGKIEKRLSELSEYSAVIDLYGIIYTDRLKKKKMSKILNILFPFLFINRLWLLANILKVPVIKNTAAIGPCDRIDNKFNIMINLGMLCDIVVARDEISLDICRKLGMKRKCMLSPDTAFCTPVSENRNFSLEQSALQGDYIGFGVSYQIAWRFKDKDYCDLVADFLEKLITHFSFNVVLIPNEFDMSRKDNDVVFALKIKEIMKRKYNKEIFVFESQDFTADKIKGFVSSCSAVITARYHTMVAALSTATPVFVISWHHKYKTAMEMFGCDKYVIEQEEFDVEKSCSDFIEFYEKRGIIKTDMQLRYEDVKRKVTETAETMNNYIIKAGK